MIFRKFAVACGVFCVVQNIAFADIARTSSYNSVSAIAYASKWTLVRNPVYPNLVDNDCTNFASQVLQAGGWKKMWD